jgi:hypothetical protein
MLFAVRDTKLRLGVVEQGCARAVVPKAANRTSKKRYTIRYKIRVKTLKNLDFRAKRGRR